MSASAGANERHDDEGHGDEQHGDVLVRVVDPSGKPRAGIPLRLDRPANDASGTHAAGPLATDEDGRARFPGLRRALENAAEPWMLRHELPCAEAPTLALERSTLAGPEVVSVLPWGGALEIVVRDVDGSVAPERCTVQLKLVPEGERLNPVLSGPDWKREPRNGAALFPWVELGRTWEVLAWRPEGTVPSRERVRGPSAAEESVRVEIVLGADHPVVSFRALDVGGNPLASRALQLTRRQLFGYVESSLETDAEGRFTIDVEATPRGGGDLVVTHRPHAGPVLQGRASLPASPRDGWNDGGDVVLESEPLLCAGSVVDEGGTPVPGAHVVVGAGDGGWFSDSRSLRGASDEHGRFELRGLWNEDEFDLRAEQHWPRADPIHRGLRARWHQEEPALAGQQPSRSDTLRARPGQRDVLLVLSARHTLSGRLLLDPGIDPRVIQFRLKRPEGEPFSAERRRDLFDGGGDMRFALEPVPGGVYELRCLLEGLELARVEGLTLHDDVDLGSIDLRGRIQVCELVLLGAEDPAKVAGDFSWNPRGSDERHKGKFDSSSVKILTPTVPIDIALRPRGYRQALLADVSGRRELVLEPPLRVRLVLHTDGEFPEFPYLLGCRLSQDDADVGEPRGMRYFTRESRELELLVSAAGRLRVRWNLERRVEGVGFGGARGSGVLRGHEVEIEVLDVPGEQVFPIQLDGAALTALAREPPW